MENTVKLIIAITSLITVLIKLIDIYISNNRKKELTSDLEFIKKALDSEISQKEKERLQKQKSHIINEFINNGVKRFDLFPLFYSLVIFAGFGWWTVELYSINDGFTPWMILTMIISFVGLGILIENDWNEKEEGKNKVKTKFQVTIFNEIFIGIVTIPTSIIGGVLVYYYYDGYSNWLILFACMLIIGIITLFKNVKIKK
jgi:hypothetical protein